MSRKAAAGCWRNRVAPDEESRAASCHRSRTLLTGSASEAESVNETGPAAMAAGPEVSPSRNLRSALNWIRILHGTPELPR